MKLNILLVFMLITIIFAGCTTTSEDRSKDPISDTITNQDDSSQLVVYGVAGFINDISINKNNTLSIFVEGDLNTNGADYDKAYVNVSADTIIYMTDKATMDNLKVGQYVQVFFEGPVMESYPVQASAKQISIVDEPIFIEDPTEVE